MSAKKILCPIDFSPGSQQAMRVAVRLANEADGELVLVHVWYVPPSAFAGEYTFSPAVIQEMNDDAQQGLDEAVKEATSLGAKRVTAKLVTGVPWHAIVELLADPQFELVVIGTHGRTGLSRVMLGSVAEKVVRHAPCSVLAVRPDGEPRPFTHVLVPVDFSESSRHAMELAADFARSGAAITLLHSIEIPVAYSGETPGPDFARDLDRRSAELLAKWAAELKKKVSVPISTRSRIGRPGTETLAVLDNDRTIDLVVMGSHGRTGIKRALMGSVAEKVVRHARCPVLVARKRT
jgi:nucleotide-binding universal stress UspA family protein